MIDKAHSDLSPELRRAVRELADTPEPSDLWRQRLLHRLEAGDHLTMRDVEPRRAWSIRPAAAIAAALACVLLGGSLTYGVMRRFSVGVRETASAAGDVQRVRFVFSAPTAARVAVVGDFNGWNPAALPMRRGSDGATWEIVVPLPPGRYAYSFVVDGALAPDPSAPRAGDDDFGSPNSVVLVKGS